MKQILILRVEVSDDTLPMKAIDSIEQLDTIDDVELIELYKE